MEKTYAIELLGGTQAAAAAAVGISEAAVWKWPEVLTPKIADRVIAALVRANRPIPPEALRTSEPDQALVKSSEHQSA